MTGAEREVGADRELGEQLAEWGKVALVTTRGRISGRPVTAAIGFVEESDGSLIVSAGAPDADWAENLLAESSCSVTVGERTGRYDAEPLDDLEHGRAVRELILRYGTPAERLGGGRSFRLRPAR